VCIEPIYQREAKPSESIDFKGKNGGSGWTRTTDLTLISFILHTLYNNLWASVRPEKDCPKRTIRRYPRSLWKYIASKRLSIFSYQHKLRYFFLQIRNPISKVMVKLVCGNLYREFWIMSSMNRVNRKAIYLHYSVTVE